jgi:hypothetical protein
MSAWSPFLKSVVDCRAVAGAPSLGALTALFGSEIETEAEKSARTVSSAQALESGDRLCRGAERDEALDADRIYSEKPT